MDKYHAIAHDQAMKKLILLRHAKSSWKTSGLDDHQRPLNKRGRAAAPVIATWLRDNWHLPDAILCSSSMRTRETVERMRETVPLMPEPVILGELYHASAEAILETVRGLDSEAVVTGMVVGHEPGMGVLARRLAEARRQAQQISAFPTAAAAIFLLDANNWAEAAPGNARLIGFAKPRDLMQG